jgi:beta-glucanase (GH16 family)
MTRKAAVGFLCLAGVALVAGVVSLDACGGRASTAPTTLPASFAWSDEFNGLANTGPDRSKWMFDLGNNNGWGNHELETYTDAIRNAHLDGSGHLVIRVESSPDGYTSARLKTRGLLVAQYGRLEARIKLPAGQGIWPAFWMLGSSFNGANWPACGEIDVMENIGREPDRVHGSLHGPGYSGGRAVSAPFTLTSGRKFSDDFHTFAIDWRPQSVVFSVDGNQYQAATPASIPSGAAWVFDSPFFVLLNVAVGGDLPGPPDASTMLPQEMLVDYVRYAPAVLSGLALPARGRISSRSLSVDGLGGTAHWLIDRLR